jgi:hypothetical protein
MNHRIGIALSLLIGLLLAAPKAGADQSKRPSPSDTQLAAAEAVGSQVQEVLEAMMNESPNGFHLRQAVVTLQTGSAKEGGFTLNFIIFTLSHTSKKGVTATTTLTFGKQQLQTFSLLEATPPTTLDQQFKNDLAAAVVLAANAVPPSNLPLTKINVKREFAVTKDTKGGLTFKITALGSASGGITIDATKTSVNSIELSYSK